jgi:hypothetical protein
MRRADMLESDVNRFVSAARSCGATLEETLRIVKIEWQCAMREELYQIERERISLERKP